MTTTGVSPLPGSTTCIVNGTVFSGTTTTGIGSGQGFGTWTSDCCCGHGIGSTHCTGSWLCFDTALLRPGGRVISCLICI